MTPRHRRRWIGRAFDFTALLGMATLLVFALVAFGDV